MTTKSFENPGQVIHSFVSPIKVEQDFVKQQESEKIEQQKLDFYRNKVRNKVISLIESKTAPWFIHHNGDVELSFFPESQYVPTGFMSVWLKIREQELGSSDPRWYSRRDIFGNGYHIKRNQKATLICFRKADNSIHFAYYWNACQLTKIPAYEKKYAISSKKVSFYTPQYKISGNSRIYPPQELLKADIANWLYSLQKHCPFFAHRYSLTDSCVNFLLRANPNSFLFIAKDAAIASRSYFEVSSKNYSDDDTISLE